MTSWTRPFGSAMSWAGVGDGDGDGGKDLCGGGGGPGGNSPYLAALAAAAGDTPRGKRHRRAQEGHLSLPLRPSELTCRSASAHGMSFHIPPFHHLSSFAHPSF